MIQTFNSCTNISPVALTYWTGTPPGSSVSPKRTCQLVITAMKAVLRTATCPDVLLVLLLLGAFDQVLSRLQFQNRASLAEALFSKSIHGTLKGAVFPAKEIVAVRSMSRTSI